MSTRQPTAYNLFVKEHFSTLQGTPQERMKQLGEMWRRHKMGKSLKSKPITKRGTITKKIDERKALLADFKELAPKPVPRKQRPADYIPPSILKGMSPELIKKMRKFYNPEKEYSLADEFAEKTLEDEMNDIFNRH
jgi:hypothetical protein